MSTTDECNELIDGINDKITTIISAIEDLNNQKTTLETNAKNLKIKSEKFNKQKKLEEFISGKRRGVLSRDPWSADMCDFVKKDGSIMTVKLNTDINDNICDDICVDIEIIETDKISYNILRHEEYYCFDISILISI